jgi:hypothetical protein
MEIKLEVAYQTDGKGRYWKKFFKEKCNEKIFVKNCCQRERGHDGQHWSYLESGAYLSSLPEGGCLILYPDDKEYISPKDNRYEYYLSHSSDWIEITDKEEIRKIEEDEDACVDRPIDFESEKNV